MGLLRFLIITICVLWLIRLVFRLLLPYLFQKVVKKAQHQATKQYQQQYTNQRSYRKPEGTIRVDYVPPKDKEARAADKAGEFVDFEEIK